MNKRFLDRDSPEYCIAAGRIGMDGLFSHPFNPFIVIFCDLCADRSAPWTAYKILDPRAIEIEEFGAGYKIGLAINEDKGARDVYLSIGIQSILGPGATDITFPFQDGWYTWTQVPSENNE
jgi:hypothetical protein